MVISIEAEEEWPEANTQDKVNLKVDCCESVSGERTKLTEESTLEESGLELAGPDKVFDTGERLRSARETLISSTLQVAVPEEPAVISPSSFSFWEGLIRRPFSLTIEI